MLWFSVTHTRYSASLDWPKVLHSLMACSRPQQAKHSPGIPWLPRLPFLVPHTKMCEYAPGEGELCGVFGQLCFFLSTYFPYFSITLLIKLTLITDIITNKYRIGEVNHLSRKTLFFFLSKESLTKHNQPRRIRNKWTGWRPVHPSCSTAVSVTPVLF